MKIAVTAENNNGLESLVAQHFGHAPFFMLVDVENGEVSAVEAVANPFAEAHQPGQIPDFIHQQKADVMLSGGMGGRSSFSNRPASRPPLAQPAPCANRWKTTWAVS